MADTLVKIAFRRTLEVSEQLSVWLDDPIEHGPGAMSAAIRDVVDEQLLELRTFAKCCDDAPCVGLVGGADARKAQVVAAALGTGSQRETMTIGERRTFIGNLPELVPQHADPGVTAVLRFVETRQLQGARNTGLMPVRLSLLSQLDLVKIFATVYHSYLPQTEGASRIEELRATLSHANDQLVSNTVPGIARDDIIGLQGYLRTMLPQSSAWQILGAAGYWDWLKAHVAYLSETGRRHMFSALWRREPTLTVLFERLSDALQKTGSRISCPHDSLVAVDNATGEMIAHPDSLLASTTLRDLASDAPPSGHLRVATSRSPTLEIERAVLAGLIESVSFEVSESALAGTSTQLAVFPDCAPPTDVSTEILRPESSAALPWAVAVHLYARAKASYLFTKACLSGQLSGIVVQNDPEREDDLYAVALGEWVEQTHGADPGVRERAAPALDIVGPAPPGDLQGEAVRDAVGASGRWARNWTHGRPFPGLHLVEAGGERTSRSKAGTLIADVGSLETGASPVNGDPLHDRLGQDPSSSAAALLRRQFASCSQLAKQRQLRHRLAQIRKVIRGRLLRRHRSNAPQQLTDWRLQVANVARNRLFPHPDASRIARLLDLLMPSESMLAAVIQNTAIEARDPLGDFDVHDVVAKACVSQWLRQAALRAGSRRACRDLDLDQSLLLHIIDELAIASERLGLVSGITQELRAQRPPLTEPDGDAGVFDGRSSIAADAIARFLEAIAEELPRPMHRLRPSPVPTFPQARSAGTMPALYPRDFAPPGAARQAPQINSAAGSIRGWAEGFRAVVEENVAASNSLATHGDGDWELGELIAQFEPNSLEVEL